MEIFESKYFVTVQCEQDSTWWSFKKADHARIIEKIRALKNFICKPCEDKNLTDQYRKREA